MAKNCNCQSNSSPCGCQVKDLGTQCVVYTGQDLPNLNIAQNTQLEDIIQKIDEAVPYFRNGFVTKGEWEIGETYSKNDAVTYDGNLYISLVNNNDTDPTSNLWELMVEKGVSNVLSIGTVIGGESAGATITGTSPSQTLNLVLPKGDAFTYADFTPEQLEDLKGEKGDSDYQIAVENGFVGTEAEWLESLKLHYSDLTEVEILELQQPAIEAAQTANTAADNANTATQNAITATNEANTATVSANQSAQTANASATNADNSADLATSAATNANDAATAANTAANFANSQRGWSPKFVFEEDGTQRLVKKLDSWIGGTGTAPTDNVGMYVADGGYVADKSLAENFKGAMGDNLLFEYVHSGNKEVYIDSIDYATNTFTSVEHGLVNGDRLAIAVNNDCDIGLEIPFNDMPPSGATVSNNGYFVINSTANTFQIGTTSTSIVVLTNKGTDLTKFRFELNQAQNISFSNLGGFKTIEIIIQGCINRIPRYLSQINSVNTGTGYRLGVPARNTTDTALSGCIRGTFVSTIITNGTVDYSNQLYAVRFGSGSNVNVVSETSSSTYFGASIVNGINSIGLTTFLITNGTTIKIYKR